MIAIFQTPLITYNKTQFNPTPSDSTEFHCGASGRTRTRNLLVRSQTLYPVALRKHIIVYHFQNTHIYCVTFLKICQRLLEIR